MTTLTTAWMLGCVCGFFLGVTVAGRRRPTCRELMSKHYSSAAIAWRDAETQRDANDTVMAKHAAELYAKLIDSSVGEPWPEPMTVEKGARRGSNPPPTGRKPAPPAGPPVRFDEGQTQRGNGSGGPTTPKPPIKPQPSGGRMIDQSGMTIGYQPLPRSGRTLPPPRNP